MPIIHDLMEHPISLVILFVFMAQINCNLLIPSILWLILVFMVFKVCWKTILASSKLDTDQLAGVYSHLK